MAGAAGLSTLVNLVALVGVGRALPTFPLFLLIASIGPMVGVVTMYFDGVLLSLLGRVFGGQARVSEVAIVFSWANAPRLADLGLWILLALTMGGDVFSSGVNVDSLADPGKWNGWLLVPALLITLWMYLLWSLGLAEAHGYSILSAVATLLLSRLLVGAMTITFVLMLPVALYWGEATLVLLGAVMGLN